jgi:hypothetical protein
LGSIPLQFENMPFEIAQRFVGIQDKINISFKDGLSSEESLKFIKSNSDYLVCIPSLVDNSPYVIVECIEQSINFLTTNSGGQSELIHPTDWPYNLCKSSAADLAKSLAMRLDTEPHYARPSKLARNANRMWKDFHSELNKDFKKTIPKINPEISSSPLVSIVCGFPGIKQHSVYEALYSIAVQKYKNIEVCVPASMRIHHIPGRQLTSIQLNSEVTQWQAALQQAKGKYIIFLNEAQLASPRSIKEAVQVAEVLEAEGKSVAAINGVIKEVSENYTQLRAPFPEGSLHLSLTHPGSVHALWNRNKLLQLSNRWNLDFSSDLNAWKFFTAAYSDGDVIGQLPNLFIIRPIPEQKSIHEIANARKEALRPRLSSEIKDMQSHLHSTIALFHENQNLRNQNLNK